MNILLLSLLSDFFKILVAKRDFFQKTSAERRQLLPQSFLPETLETYFVSISDEQFEQDLKNLLRYFHAPQVKVKLNVYQGTIFEALGEFFMVEFAAFLDHGKMSINYQSSFGKTLKDYLVTNSSQEITAEVIQFLSFIYEIPVMVIQSAREIPPDLKIEIRHGLRLKYPHSFAAFSVQKKLIGGFRLLINGITLDYSWLFSINRLTSH